MSPSIISLIALFLIFMSAVAGIFIQNTLPEHHLSEESKNIIKAARGVVVGLAALTLGLLIATAKGSFDTKGTELKASAAKTIVLNRLLLNFGDKSKEARDALKIVAENGIKVIEEINKNGVDRKKVSGLGLDLLQKKLLELPDDKPELNWLKNTALSLGNDIAISRWKIYENSSASVSPLFIAILVFWLMGIFFSLGLIAPFNTLVLTALFMAALSMTGAILLTLELDQPYGGLIQFSTDPLKIALEQFR
jgi:hypothetical protein